jgi:Phage integrase SAM-like domain
LIQIFRRHLSTCPCTSRTERKCKCPIHAEGTLGGAKFPRRSLDLNSWEAAQKKVRAWEAAGTTQEAPQISLKEATARFLADGEARGISKSASAQNEILLTRLQTFMDEQGLTTFSSLGPAEIRRFREYWTRWGKLTHIKHIERLRAFYRVALQNKWVTESPVAFLKPPQAPTLRAVPFTDEEMTRVHSAVSKPRTRAFVFILQVHVPPNWDAVRLQTSDIVDGKLMLQTQKRQTIVWLPLPPFVLSALAQIKTTQYIQ